jgi:hypothetical protein
VLIFEGVRKMSLLTGKRGERFWDLSSNPSTNFSDGEAVDVSAKVVQMAKFWPSNDRAFPKIVVFL